MAKKSGRNGVVRVGGNVVANLISITWDETVEMIDATDMDSTVKDFEAGDATWTGEMEVHWNKADATGQGALSPGVLASLEFMSEGVGTGLEQVTTTAYITRRGRSGITRSDMIKQNFSLQGNSAMAIGSQA